jgi:hypothetical protein
MLVDHTLVLLSSEPITLLREAFLPKSLRAYGPSFSGNGALKRAKNHLFYCRISTILQPLITIKILQGRSF